MEKRLRERMSSDWLNLGFISRGGQGLTLLLMLWCAYRQESSMAALQEAQQAAERARCRYLWPTSGQKLLTPGVELGKGWKKQRRKETP